MTSRALIDRSLDLDTLEVLERVATLGSLSRAAEDLGVTQQAVSARVRRAERAVGHDLVARTAAGSALTESGRLVLELATPLLEASRRFETGLQALQQPRGALVIAASQTIAEMLVPEWLRAFRAAAPDTAVRLLAGNSARVTELVRSGAAQLGFIESPAPPPDLASHVVRNDELAVVVAPQHPWATRDAITLAELAATPLLMREAGSGTRATVEAWLAAHSLQLAEPAAVLETTAIIRANARAGVAPAVLSLQTVLPDLEAGALVRVALDAEVAERTFRAVWFGTLAAPARAFARVVRSGSERAD